MALALVLEMTGDDAVPSEAELAHAAGLFRRGDMVEAGAICQRFLAAHPDHIGALHLLGAIAAARGQHTAALEPLKRAIALKTDFVPALLTIGRVLMATGGFDAAAEAFARVVELDPDNAEASFNLGQACQDAGRLDAAAEAYGRALSLSPNMAAARLRLGVVLQAQGDHEAALDTFNHVLMTEPANAEAHFQLGCLHRGQGNLADAETRFGRALAADPGHRGASVNLGLLLLLTGRIGEGARLYERRQDWSRFPTANHPLPMPRWAGEDMGDGTLLVAAEQGIGEQLLHAGLIADLAARGVAFLWECNHRLLPLLARSFPETRFVARTAPPQPEALAAGRFIPGGNLIPLLRPNPARFPDHRGYLTADPARVAALRGRYMAGHDGSIVGIAWRTTQPRAPGKTIPLEQWAPVLGLEGARFVSLQHGPVADEIEAAALSTGVAVIHDSDVDPLKDLEAAAAQVAAMDAVVTISNTTAHLAGAMGKPGLVLLEAVPLWHWFLGGKRSAWYPTLDLVRQEAPGAWGQVVARAGTALKGLIRNINCA